MKAIVFNRYGPPNVLQLAEVETPSPRDHQVRIRIHATTVTAGDCELRSFTIPMLYWLPLRMFMGVTRPRVKILGQEFSGEIESIGKKVTKFKVGEQVFSATTMNFGAYAEYICLSENHPIARRPVDVSHHYATTIPTGGLNALHFVRKSNLRIGAKVLINGAGGSIGTYAVQFAKAQGAEITCVDSASKFSMLRSIGADHVIDFKKEDFTKRHELYDAIIDVVGTSCFSDCIRSLTNNGRYILGNPTFTGMMKGLWISNSSDKKVVFDLAKYRTADMDYIANMIRSGTIRPVLDKQFPLQQMQDAHLYVENEFKTGSIIININEKL